MDRTRNPCPRDNNHWKDNFCGDQFLVVLVINYGTSKSLTLQFTLVSIWTHLHTDKCDTYIALFPPIHSCYCLWLNFVCLNWCVDKFIVGQYKNHSSLLASYACIKVYACMKYKSGTRTFASVYQRWVTEGSPCLLCYFWVSSSFNFCNPRKPGYFI